MHDGWRRELIKHAASLKLASASGEHILDPFAFPSVGERNEKSLRLAKNIRRCSVEFARLSTRVSQNTETGQAGGEPAGDSVRNRQVEGCDPPFAEPDQKDGNQQDCQEQDGGRGDQHVR